ncbi:hypothetical protein PRZ48_005308 [Zasmidium cellare]|uniref:Ubiquitin-like protease family profile domain-containing protein n=1 Tax=Zasmidium cellare TaxID=395010 RepID=A0ABR0ES19_ZASCE|nr:hypothetical protein PRZ48_005308 [Zasmidium cellare]
MESTPVSAPSPGHSKVDSVVSNGSGEGGYDKQRKIRQWIEDIDAIDNVTSRSSMAGTELNSVISSEDSRAGRMPDGLTLRGSDSDTTHPRITTTSGSILDEDEADSDDDFFVEAAQQALGKGKEAFGQSDYPGAAAYLTEALTMIKGLSSKQQASCDTWELRRMLGVCAFHVNGPLDAEAALLSVLDNAPKNAILNEQQRLQVSETAHLLAQTYIKLASLEKAYRYCEYALRGRRRVLGKNHHQSYESLALMARILQLQDNNLRAEFFIVMIPEGVRETYVKQYADLILPEVPPRIEEPRPIAPVISPVRSSFDKSLKVTMDEVAGPPPQVPERRRPRPVSNFSAQVSSVASDFGGTGTVSSISPPASPEIARRPVANLSPSDNTYLRPTLGQPRSISDQMVPTQQQPFQERPAYPRSPSDIPYRPQVSAVHENQKSNQAQTPPGLMPQPLRLQRPTIVSELPGDNSFIHVQAPPTPPSSLPSAEEKIFVPQVQSSPQLLHPAERDSISSGRPYTPSIYSQATAEAPPRSSMATTLDRSSSDSPHRRKSSHFLQIFRSNSSSTSENTASTKLSFSYNNVRLSRKDYDSIKSEALSDNAVDFWQEHLEHTMIKGNPKFTLLRPIRAQLLQDSSDPAALKAALPDLSTTMHIFVPLRSSSNHWSLLLVSPTDNLACHYDPYRGRNLKLASKVTHRISEHLATKPTFLDVPDTPEISTDKDSGIYVCVFMQHLITKLMETLVSQKIDATLQMKAIDVKATRKAMVKVVEGNMKAKEKVKTPSATSALNRAFAYPYVGSVKGGLETKG